MAVVIETTLGDITVDLYLDQRPITCLNFLKLCKMKYYNFNLFHSIRSGFIAQTGDPTGEGSGGQSIFGVLEGPEKRFFSGEKMPRIRHTDAGLISMVCTGEMMVGSQFFFTLAPDLDSLDGVHCVIGEVTEGQDVLRKLNDVICDETHRPYRDVRITHTVVLEDPFNDPPGLRAPSRSPSPRPERLKGGRIAPDEDLDETQGKSAAEIQEMIEEKEAKARATILEIVGDLPDADIAPPENVLFVCKLNPVTTDDDLEIIFSRFGKIVSCEVIRDKKTGESLQYAFIEFSDKKSCEDAYFKMDNVLIDDRRIHVDFSQSVSKMRWLGKGRGVKYFNDDGNEIRGENRRYDSRRPQSRERSNKSHKNERNHLNNSQKDENKPKEKERDRQKRSERPYKYEREKDSNGKTHRKKSRSRSKGNEPQNERNNHSLDYTEDTKDRRHKDKRIDPHKQERDRHNSSNRNDRRHERDELHYDERRQDKADRTNERDARRQEKDVRRQEKNDRKNHRDQSKSDREKYTRKNEEDMKNTTAEQETDKKNHNKEYSHNRNDKRREEKPTKRTQKIDKYEKNKNKAESDKEIAPGTPSPVLNKNKQKDKKNPKHNMKIDKKSKKNSNKRKRKPSTSSSDSSTDSSSSTESSSSSYENRKKKSVKRRKKKYSTSSDSSDSSSSSSSSSSDSSSSSSSSDSDSRRKKTKKHTNKKKKL